MAPEPQRGCSCRINPSVGVYWISSQVPCGYRRGVWDIRWPVPGQGTHSERAWAWESLGCELESSLTSLGWNLWTLLTSLSFRLVLGKTTSSFQGCVKDLNVYQMLGQHMGHMVEMQGNDHCYQPCQPVVPFNGKYKLEMQILGGGNSCCQLVFSGKFNLK